MSDPVDELIKEIAVKHNIAVSRDDPIMVLHTINERLMRDSAKAQQDMLDTFKEELESIAFRWGADAKEKAERILNAALTASAVAFALSCITLAIVSRLAVKAEVDAALRRVTAPVEDATRIARLNIAAACLAFAAAAIVLFASL